MSAPNSTKGTLFKEKLSAKPIKYRDCEPENLVISDCLSEIKKEIENDEDAVLIGSSLGGFLAAKTALENENVKQIILLNPAIIPLSVDISKINGMPQSILSDIQDESLFKNKISSDIYILIGLQDDVVPIKWPLEFAMSQNSTIKFFEDDHSFSKNLQKLPQIIKKILVHIK
jgi:predicted esterase YcpF (UPF0227 family)